MFRRSRALQRTTFGFDFDPDFRRSRFINRRNLLAYNSFQAEIANGGKQFVAMPRRMFDVLIATGSQSLPDQKD